MRLFCFPYAGSGANIFYKWPDNLPETVEICLVHLPGREHRLKEKPIDRMSRLVQALERPLLPYLDKPIALFGHSLGALIGFELSRHLRRRYGVQPAHLFISGCNAPQGMQMLAPLDHLTVALSLCMLRPTDGPTAPLPNDARLLELMLPTLKADFALCETYSYINEQALDCAISAYGGLQDRMVGCESLESWGKETAGPFTLRLFPGDHFFIHTARSLVLDALSGDLDSLAGRLN